MQAEHARLLQEGWHLCADGCYRKRATSTQVEEAA